MGTVVVGVSEKLDGIMFMADSDNAADAANELVNHWNSKYDDKMGVVECDNTFYMLFQGQEVDVQDLEGDPPRWEGYVLEFYDNNDKLLLGMGW